MAASRTGSVDAVRAAARGGRRRERRRHLSEADGADVGGAEGHADVVKALLDAQARIRIARRTSPTLDRTQARRPSDRRLHGADVCGAQRSRGRRCARSIKGGADPKLTNGDGATATIDRHRQRSVRPGQRRCSTSAPTPNDGSLYFAVDMHDATTDMRARDGSRLRADHPNKLTALDLVKLLLDRGADPNKAFVGQLHSTTLCCGEEVNASPFYPRRGRGRRRGAEADDRARRAGRVEPDRGQEGRKDGARRRRPRQRQRRQDADDGGDRRRPRRGVRRRPGLRASRAAAVPRSVESRAGSRRSRCCSPPAPIRTPRRRTARRCCIRR